MEFCSQECQIIWNYKHLIFLYVIAEASHFIKFSNFVDLSIMFLVCITISSQTWVFPVFLPYLLLTLNWIISKLCGDFLTWLLADSILFGGFYKIIALSLGTAFVSSYAHAFFLVSKSRWKCYNSDGIDNIANFLYHPLCSVIFISYETWKVFNSLDILLDLESQRLIALIVIECFFYFASLPLQVRFSMFLAYFHPGKVFSGNCVQSVSV